MIARNLIRTSKYLLGLIPLIYVFLGCYFQQMTGLYSLRSIDPEYIYFISGLSIANGEFELGHIDNPGTPLQYLLAILFKIIYAFRSQQTPFIEDVLANSDLYLSVSNLLTIILVGSFLLFAGVRVFKQTQNIGYALLVQTTPFFTGIVYGNIGRVTPENILPIPVILLSIFLISFITQNKEIKENRNIFILAIIAAFGLSIKLTFLPLSIIPFLVIDGWKNKLKYVGITPLFFFAFALPATLQIEIFWNWVKALFLNSGQYGEGEKSIIDLTAMMPNLEKMWNENGLFFLVFILFIGIILTSIIISKKSKKGILPKTALAIVLASILQIFLISKHFEQRYFVNALFLIPLMVILCIEATKEWHIQNKKQSLSFVISVLFILTFSKTQVPIIRQLSTHLTRQQEKRMPAYHFFKGIEDNATKIFVPGYYNCPSPEYALRFSYGWAGKQKELYKPYLAKLFPNSIIFYFWDSTFNVWGEQPELDQKESPIYIYLEHYKHLELITTELKKHIKSDFSLQQSFLNEESNEAIYTVQFN